jgi:polyisoprenoid-binding protein YceI
VKVSLSRLNVSSIRSLDLLALGAIASIGVRSMSAQVTKLPMRVAPGSDMPLRNTRAADTREHAVRRASAVRGTLSFTGHATVGDFIGTTSALSGTAALPVDVREARGVISAPADSLRTGNRLRDRDMRQVLEVSRYPTLRFDLDSIATGSAAPFGGDSIRYEDATLFGRLTIHGVTHQVALPGVLQIANHSADVRSVFPLDLEDYSIGGLSKLFGLLRMYPKIEVSVDLSFEFE